MICQRCLHRRSGESFKCDGCNSRFHSKCLGEAPRDIREGGDRLCQWRCAVCHKSTSHTNIDLNSPTKEEILHAINSISEKFELVNKIQLPKLNSDLMQVKSITEQIKKQNEDILLKIAEFESKRSNVVQRRPERKSFQSQSYRRRSINLTSKKIATKSEDCDRVPILPQAEKNIRYRTRRSHLFHKMFYLLNRNIKRRSRTPRK